MRRGMRGGAVVPRVPRETSEPAGRLPRPPAASRGLAACAPRAHRRRPRPGHPGTGAGHRRRAGGVRAHGAPTGSRCCRTARPPRTTRGSSARGGTHGPPSGALGPWGGPREGAEVQTLSVSTAPCDGGVRLPSRDRPGSAARVGRMPGAGSDPSRARGPVSPRRHTAPRRRGTGASLTGDTAATGPPRRLAAATCDRGRRCPTTALCAQLGWATTVGDEPEAPSAPRRDGGA